MYILVLGACEAQSPILLPFKYLMAYVSARVEFFARRHDGKHGGKGLRTMHELLLAEVGKELSGGHPMFGWQSIERRLTRGRLSHRNQFSGRLRR